MGIALKIGGKKVFPRKMTPMEIKMAFVGKLLPIDCHNRNCRTCTSVSGGIAAEAPPK